MKEILISVVTIALWLLVASAAVSLLRPERPWGTNTTTCAQVRDGLRDATWRRSPTTPSKGDVAVNAARCAVSRVGGRLEGVRPHIATSQKVMLRLVEPLVAPFRPLRLNLAVVADDQGRRRLNLRTPYGDASHSLDLAPLLAGLVLSAVRIYLTLI